MDKLWRQVRDEFPILLRKNDYRAIGQDISENIMKSGLLLDEHDELLEQYLELGLQTPPDPANILSLIPKGLALSTPLAQWLTGMTTPLIAVGIFIPFSLHYIILKLRKRKISKHVKDFKKLTMVLKQLYELFVTVDRYYIKQKSVITNLNPHLSRALARVLFPKINKFLLEYGKGITALSSKLNDLIQKTTDALNLHDLERVYQVNFERIDFSLPDVPTNDAYEAYFERCYLSYSLVVSSLLCAICFGVCSYRNSEVINYKKFLNEILPEALELVSTGLTKMSEEFKGVHGTLPKESNIEEDVLEVSDKLKPIKRTLTDLIRQFRLIFEFAQIMYNDLQQTDRADLEFILEGHYENIEKLYSDCQETLNHLKRNVCRQVKIEGVKAARQREQLVQSEAEVTVGGVNINDSAGTSIIRHDDPDTPAYHEEYSLSMHGSDDEDNEEEFRKIVALEHVKLVECIKTQKLMIKELNDELKTRKLITQEEGASTQHQIPMARVLPTKKSTNAGRNMRIPGVNSGQNSIGNLYIPLSEYEFIPPPENFSVAGNEASPPEPPPLPEIDANNVTLENYQVSYGGLPEQIHAAAQNWAGNEEVFENDMIVEDILEMEFGDVFIDEPENINNHE